MGGGERRRRKRELRPKRLRKYQERAETQRTSVKGKGGKKEEREGEQEGGGKHGRRKERREGGRTHIGRGDISLKHGLEAEGEGEGKLDCRRGGRGGRERSGRVPTEKKEGRDTRRDELRMKPEKKKLICRSEIEA